MVATRPNLQEVLTQATLQLAPQSELSNYILTVSKFSLSTAIHNNEHNCKTRSKEEPTLLNVIYIKKNSNDIIESSNYCYAQFMKSILFYFMSMTNILIE